MADKQISALTEVTTHTNSDLFVVQQSSTAKKTTLGAIKDFIYRIAGISSTASSIADANYFLVSQSGTPKKVSASTMKSYFSSSGGGSGALYAVYGTTSYNTIATAINADKAVWAIDDLVYAPLVEWNNLGLGDSISFLDIANQRYLVVDENSNWSRVSM